METAKFWLWFLAIMVFLAWVCTKIPMLFVPFGIFLIWFGFIAAGVAIARVSEWLYTFWHRVGDARKRRRD
jgi:hypothetical protein